MKKIDNNNYFLNKILVVEDYEGLRKLVQKELERYGFITDGVNSGEEAIKWVKNNHDEKNYQSACPQIRTTS